MPGQAPVTSDERSQLLTFLTQQRDGLTFAAHGLSDDQARLTPTRSALSIGGIIKHVASTESGWIDLVLQRPLTGGDEEYFANFRMTEDETLHELIARLDAAAAETERVIAGIEDLNQPVPVPKGVPWYPADLEAWTVRWVLLHLIEETARHAGHADIIRESIDGATAIRLMAAAEGWPETPWIKPWKAEEAAAQP
jgi:uncharacterized damage-inducible protein DinB